MNKLQQYLNEPLPVQPYLLKFFSKDDPITIFDIGACEAEDSIRYSKLFPSAKIFSFEPVASNFKKATENIRAYDVQQVELFKLALCDTNGMADFYLSSGHPESLENTDEWNYGNKSSSLLQPGKVKDVFNWLQFKEVTKVETKTLDTFCNEHSVTRIDYLHMDVQGAELLVLKGAEKMLRQISSIWLEVEKIELYKDQPLEDEVNAFLTLNGFVRVFENINHTAGDQFFVKESLLKKKEQEVEVKKVPSFPLGIKNKFMQLLGLEKKYSEVTYSQSGEDAIIHYIFQCIGISKPSYIDIGAHHPFRLNNTALFYSKGSRGINIEPDPLLFEEFVKYRKEDINLNIGISDTEGELDFYRMSSATMNTFSKKEAEQLVEQSGFQVEKILKIKVQHIENIIQTYHHGVFPDLLTLDVEGLDFEIIQTINYEKNYPIVICVETMSFSENGQGEKNFEMIEFLKDKNYIHYADTYINSIFVKKDRWMKPVTQK